MLIGLMSLPNQVVYIQFHPIAYMAKLNIEMSMADLIVKTARSSEIDVHPDSSERRPFPDTSSKSRNIGLDTGHDYVGGQAATVRAGHVPQSQNDQDRQNDMKGITRQREVQVFVHDSDSDSASIEDAKRAHSNTTDERLGHNSGRRQSDESQIPLKDLQPRDISYAC